MIFDALPPPVRDTVYVAVGLPVVAVQEAQQRRQAVADDLAVRLEPLRRRAAAVGHQLTGLVPKFDVSTPSLSGINTRIDERVKAVEERVNTLEARFDEVLDKFGEQLPEGARDVLTQAREAARDARTQLRSLVTRAA